MNGKERVKAVIRGEKTDRIPLGFYIADCDTIESVIGRPTLVRNKIASAVALWEGRRDEVVESYKKDTVEFYQKLDCVDLICFKEAPFVPEKNYNPGEVPRKTGDDTWEFSDGRVLKQSELSNELVCIHDPNKKDFTDFTVAMYPVPGPDELTPPDPSIYEAVDYVLEHLGSDRYIAGKSGGIVALTLPGGMESGLMLHAAAPEVIHAASEAATVQGDYLDDFHIRDGQDGVLLEQDMAGTNGPMLSPAMFRGNCFPYMQRRIAHIKTYDQQVLLHNCGDNRPLMDMLIDAGIDCYQSIQTTSGMDLAGLQEAYGDRIVFWGGIALEVLVLGSMDDVRKNVREALETGARAPRGFILGPSHSIAYGTRYDNFMAMLDEYNRLADKF